MKQPARAIADLAKYDLVAVLDNAGRVMLTDRVSRVGRREISVGGYRYRLKDGTSVGPHWGHRDGDCYAARIRPAVDGDVERVKVRQDIARLTLERNMADRSAGDAAAKVVVLRQRLADAEAEVATCRAASEKAIAELTALRARAEELGDGG